MSTATAHGPHPARRSRRHLAAALAAALAGLALLISCTVPPPVPEPIDPDGPVPSIVLGPAVSITREPGFGLAAATGAIRPIVAAVADRPVLRGDGLGIVSLGDDATQTIATLRTELGEPDHDTGWHDGVRSLNFGLLYIELHEDGDARTLAGIYYSLPSPDHPLATPILDTDPPVGLGSGAATWGDLAALGPLADRHPDHAGAACVSAPGGRLCAYAAEPLVDERGEPAIPAADAQLVAVVAGSIRPFGHCSL
jgi:hypothetical protein